MEIIAFLSVHVVCFDACRLTIKVRSGTIKVYFSNVKMRFCRANVGFFDANVRFLRQKSEVLRSISSRGTFCFPTRNRVFCRTKHFVPCRKTLCSNTVKHFVPTAQNTLFQ